MRAFVVVVIVGGFACADPNLVPLGGTCTQTLEGEASDCAGQLYCSVVTGHCERRANAGEACNGEARIPCADGLLCNYALACAAPAPEGTTCQFTTECATGLECNHGYLPDDASLGECHALSQVGGPCAYTTYVMGAANFTGCFPGLTCVPPTTPTLVSIYTSDVAPPVYGFAGTCEVPGSIPMGAACLEATACADGGFCYALPPPVVEPIPLDQVCSPGRCYFGPWTGLCGPGAQPHAPTAGEDCATTACAPGFACDYQHVCRARFQGGALARCDLWGTGALDDELCTIGRHCEGSPPECVLGAPL